MFLRTMLRKMNFLTNPIFLQIKIGIGGLVYMVLLTMILNPLCTHALCPMTLELLPLKEQSLFSHPTHFNLRFSHLTCFG